MAILFTTGLIAYYFIFLRPLAKKEATLAMLLWFTYFLLGLSASYIQLTELFKPVFEPNYLSVFILLISVVISIAGFSAFRARDLQKLFVETKNRRLIENVLIFSQIYSIAFFLPFAADSFSGNINENRWMLADKMDQLGSYGIFNTLASVGSHLFTASLVLAFLRFGPSEKQGRNIRRGVILLVTSLSYVVYILAYVGRDGVVYWLMNVAMVFLLFRHHITASDKRALGYIISLLMMPLILAFIFITMARFVDTEGGAVAGLFDYFGSQINNFSDYFSMERPMTYGVANFPLFAEWGCRLLDLNCLTWTSIKTDVFNAYLEQGKAPWFFATYISDFSADFGVVGSLIFITLLSLLCAWLCYRPRIHTGITLSRLLLMLFLFQVPYWGVFYFRYGITNGFIIYNLLLIVFVASLNRTKSIE